MLLHAESSVISKRPKNALTILELNYGQALAMSTILMLVTAVGFIAIERFRYADIGEF